MLSVVILNAIMLSVMAPCFFFAVLSKVAETGLEPSTLEL